MGSVLTTGTCFSFLHVIRIAVRVGTFERYMLPRRRCSNVVRYTCPVFNRDRCLMGVCWMYTVSMIGYLPRKYHTHWE